MPLRWVFDAGHKTTRWLHVRACRTSSSRIGVKMKALENNKDAINGVELIPEKNKSVVLKPEDSLVVVAEDEL
jgi:hypothetical protein